MFFQPPEEHLQSPLQTKTRRRKKKNSNKKRHKQYFKKKQTKLSITMSSWADDFITAATWQLNHQVAYWKSKARALEYENRILHEIIRKNTDHTTTYHSKLDVSVNNDSDVENYEDDECEEDVCKEEYEHEEDDNFEVSEEFIQFLTTNAKYKEDARKERERLKANNEEKNKLMEGPPEKIEDSIENFKELYGKDWQRITALEVSVQCDFIENVDKYKPMYWPNLPFNFNYSKAT